MRDILKSHYKNHYKTMGKFAIVGASNTIIDFAVFSLAWRSDNTPTGNWNPDCDISQPPDGIIDELDLLREAANALPCSI